MPRPRDEQIVQQKKQCIKMQHETVCCVTVEERVKIINRFRQARESLATLTAPIRVSVALLLFHLGEACVCEIQYALDASSQPLVSHHLREMKKAGWLKSVKRGRWRYYSLTTEKRAELAVLIGLREGE